MRPLIAALGVVAAAAAIALEATTFDVAFPTDPLGPKAFPVVAAVLLAIGGVALVRSARADRAEADAGRMAAGEPGGAVAPAVGGPADSGAARRIALGTASFVVYAFLLAPLGFVLATTLEFAVLARLFGGPVGRGAAAGLAFALLLYALFVYALGLPLPLGILEA